MKTIAEPRHDFYLYLPPGITYVEREAGDSLESLYDGGFLPYSGKKDSRAIFYAARSARVVVPEFSLSSENRRIAKKFDGIFAKERVPFADFKADEAFNTFCLSYFAVKHGPDAMPQARLEAILQSGLLTHVTTYRGTDKAAAYVLEVEDGSMAHYWFSFYDLAYARQSLGLWLMLDCLRDAQTRGLTHYYLGTVYAQKALYKTNFAPLEWWTGESWSRNIEALKTRARTADR